MRILLYSHWFYPSIGGVETISRVLAEAFVRAGHEVTILTSTPGEAMAAPYTVVRNSSNAQVRALARQHDILLQNTISLRNLLPVLGTGCPVVVTHHSWLRRGDGSRGLENYLKLVAVRLCENVSISKAIAAALPVPSTVICNLFEADAFSYVPGATRDRDLVFMGRLIPEKGCQLVLEAMGMLKARGLTPALSVIGDGPLLPSLQLQAEQLGIAAQVEFLGALREGRGAQVARHRILVAPSVWQEPFGLVALEGIASGCAIVASSGGGLPDAVGPCGLYFPNGDVAALAAQLERLLTDVALQRELVAKGPEHLKAFAPDHVAGRYLELFHKILTR